ncbi:MAG: hypothetical protein M5R40_19175 [Anaerolineae bacterium]|nr:hypothetical protein [Anaerolineae bacterium]
MTLNLKCPRCDHFMTLDVARGTVKCRHCGYVPLYDGNAIRDEPPAQQPAVTDLNNVPIVSQKRPSNRQESLFREGMRALKQGDPAAARESFFGALELGKDFIDPWLWLVSTTDDPNEQRQYMEWALAHEPNNFRVIEARNRLDGRLKNKAGAAKHRGGGHGIRRLQPDAPVQAESDTMNCPHCGGRMVYDIAGGAVLCAHCNTRTVIDVDGYGQHTTLVEALLKRKYQAQYWEAADRVVTCQNCGAQVTFPPRALVKQCFFCDSRHVIVADNAESFEQPDGIVPFKLDEEKAVQAVYEAMHGGVIRRLTRFMRDPISYHEAHAIYIPFWAFDATVTVKWNYPGPVEDRGEYPYILYDVLACGSDTLDRKLMARIEPFDLKQMRRYDPRYLASQPAEIYRLDVDEASLNARAQMSETARARLRSRMPARKQVAVRAGYTVGKDYVTETVELVLSALINDMTYRLVLLPVWNVMLHEDDGDIRRALVNGQTGAVALGGPLGGLL